MTNDVSTEIASIEAKMGTDEYIRDEGAQGRLRELYGSRQSGVAPPPASSVGRERAEIERIMRSEPQRYYRDEEMQARYRELLDAEMDQDSGARGDGGFIPVPSFAEWKAAGRDPAQFNEHSDLVRRANDVLWDMPDGAREQFGQVFAALPERIRSVALGQLMDNRTVSPYPLSDDAMTELRRVPAYAGLIREWGSDAPRKLAVAQERLWWVLDRLSDVEARMAMAWIDRLPRAAMAALTKQMAR